MKTLKGSLIALSILLFLMSFAFAAGEKEEVLYEGKTLRLIVKDLPMLRELYPVMEKEAENMGMNLESDWYTWEDLRKKVLLDYKAGLKNWDIIFTDEYWWFSNAGAIISIDEFINDPSIADPNVDNWLKDTYPNAINYMTLNDKLWGFPYFSDFTVLIYRTDILKCPEEKTSFHKKYGYVLNVPKTYDQYYDIINFFTRKKGELLCGEPLEDDFYGTVHSLKPGGFLLHDYLPYALAFGIPETYYYDPETMMPVWNSPAHLKGAKFLMSLKPFMPSGVGTMTSGASTAFFAEGKIAMTIEYIGRSVLICNDPKSSKIIGKWDYTVSPSVTGTGVKGACMSNQHTMMIYTLSENKKAVYKIIERMFAPDPMKKLLFEKNLIVPRKSILESPDAKELDWAKNLSLTMDPNLTSHSYHPKFEIIPKIWDIVIPPLSEMWTEIKTPEQAFNEGQEELVELFKEAGYIK